MRFQLFRPLLYAALVSQLVGVVHAVVTLQTIQDLTKSMVMLRGRILEGQKRPQATWNGQDKHSLRRDSDCEQWETAAALHELCQVLIIELNKSPLAAAPIVKDRKAVTDCEAVRTDFHAFLSSAVNFLFVVQEEQFWWQWKRGRVTEQLIWLQSLWASRRANLNNYSFIEQQMQLYASTGCFAGTQEVLESNVEIVEYLNSLIDSYPEMLNSRYL